MNNAHSLTLSGEARAWTEALPLGNGRLGAMVFGHPTRDRLALNEDTFWSGYKDSWKQDPNYDGRLQKPDPVRWQEAAELSLAGKNIEAEAILQKYYTGPYTQAYLPLGDLILDVTHKDADVSEISDYSRTLDYETATVRVSYRIGEHSYTREAFISEPDQVLVVRLKTNNPAGIDLTASLESQVREAEPAPADQAAAASLSEDSGLIYQYLQAPVIALPSYVSGIEEPIVYAEDPAEGGMAATMGLAPYSNRNFCLNTEDRSLSFSGEQEIVLLWSAGTSFNGPDKHPWTEGRPVLEPMFAALKNAARISYDELLRRHLEDYQELYQRVRWEADQVSFDDDEMMQIRRLFNFSRYLVIAGSRAGTQATTLQGIWNGELRAPWSSNYTVNINTEMNYWPTEILGLADCHEPLLSKIQGLASAGARTVAEYYGADGAVMHHNTDIWNHTEPVGSLQDGSVVYAVWPLGLGWFCWHLMEHYEYNPDPDYLADDVVPVLRAAGRFFLQMLKEDGDGDLLFAPSTSPEHWYITEDGRHSSVAAGTTMTQSIVYEVFTHYIESCTILEGKSVSLSQEDKDLKAQFAEALPRLNPWPVRGDGALSEWDQDYPDGDPHHRHLSHLYSLYPGDEIRQDSRPDLVDAVTRTLEIRGEEGTGWSLGWKTLFYARLNDAEHCLSLLRRQLRPIDPLGPAANERGGSYPNLFSAHPPFQIDGNYAASAGIAEMFLRSRIDREAGETVVVDVLPAIPEAFGRGRISGLRAKGNLELTIAYDHGKLLNVEVKNRSAEQTRHIVLRYKGKEYAAHLGAGQGFGMSEASLP